MSRIWKHIRFWLRGGNDQFTIAVDYSHWRGAESGPDGRNREKLFRVRGKRKARSVAVNWVASHPHGQARVFHGWLFWEDEKRK